MAIRDWLGEVAPDRVDDLADAGLFPYFKPIASQRGNQVIVDGREMRERDVAGRIRRGIVLVPEDRKTQGQNHSCLFHLFSPFSKISSRIAYLRFFDEHRTSR